VVGCGGRGLLDGSDWGAVVGADRGPRGASRGRWGVCWWWVRRVDVGGSGALVECDGPVLSYILAWGGGGAGGGSF